jgi:hypothetical protein
MTKFQNNKRVTERERERENRQHTVKGVFGDGSDKKPFALMRLPS